MNPGELKSIANSLDSLVMLGSNRVQGLLWPYVRRVQQFELLWALLMITVIVNKESDTQRFALSASPEVGAVVSKHKPYCVKYVVD